MADFDVVVIGGGVVGLAAAAAAARSGRTTVLLERHDACGTETSSRNSGVIHAGIYYPENSLKAVTCVAGRKLLYARCERDRIAHAKLGKIIVATCDDEVPKLEQIAARARNNGAGDLSWLDADTVRRMEPNVQAVAGLLSPETGIVDAHGLMDSYRAEARAYGCDVAFRTEVTQITTKGGAFQVATRAGTGETMTIECGQVVNAAGLSSDRIAAMAGLDVDALGYRLHPCKGDYFRLASHLRGLCRHLIYPVPVAAGLGTHLTLDLSGDISAGPDTEYVTAPRYDVSPDKAHEFGEALRRYVPIIRDEDLSPNYAGVRPKLQGPGETFRDFVVEDAAPHGLPGMINLIGIESPGLTASEAIANRVVELLARTHHQGT
ncbi:MAG: NAD(P)/FAD-dependent oxidoreductase [Myxococcales bacterium]|nr:NAD(P)/FAD-dependent oxidoreductase [Myxococcales bacterium]MDD9969395.1 NAD(P)/FAD-dependent oxidoreductase [Myxococcales bacterium]